MENLEEKISDAAGKLLLLVCSSIERAPVDGADLGYAKQAFALLKDARDVLGLKSPTNNVTVTLCDGVEEYAK